MDGFLQSYGCIGESGYILINNKLKQGKAFHFDSYGNIVSDKKVLGVHHSTLSKHKEKIKFTLQNLKSNIRSIPQNVYNSFEDQHVICQLSDKSWNLDEMFKTNNIVIFTDSEVTKKEGSSDGNTKEDDENSRIDQNEQIPTPYEEHICVDFGLSVHWASCNVGAHLPEEFGDYYAWGEISTKEKYTEDNYKWFDTTKNKESGCYPLTKYNSDDNYGYVDNKSVLDDADDVATVKWGKGWRIPTYKEWNELRKKCSWKWVCLRDVYGYQVTSPINNNSIFLPVAGEGSAQYREGHYWASTIKDGNCANSIDFDNHAKQLDYYAGWRMCGYSVRPIKTKESVDTSISSSHTSVQLSEECPKHSSAL